MNCAPATTVTPPHPPHFHRDPLLWERHILGFDLLFAARLQRVLPFYYGWMVVGASGTAVFARMAPAITTLTVFIYPMTQELGWSRTLIAGSVSAGAVLSMALSPAIGWAIDRFGSRPVLVAGVLTVGASMISLAWATIPVTFYVAYASARVVFHTAAPIGASTLASRWFVRMRGRAIGAIFPFRGHRWSGVSPCWRRWL